jgi:sortase A
VTLNPRASSTTHARGRERVERVAAVCGRRERAKRVVALCERALLTLGVLCLGIYAAACTHAAYYQSEDARAFEEALVVVIHTETHDQSEWSEARVRHYQEAKDTEVTALGRLDVPDAGVSVMVLPGTDDVTLNRAVGHIEGTALPGDPGNVGIAGHRDGFFRGLRHIEVGDDLKLTTLEGVAFYQVAEKEIVDPTDVEVLDPTDEPTITLVTCYPFYFVGDAPQRFIVKARQVRFEPWARTTLASLGGVRK